MKFYLEVLSSSAPFTTSEVSIAQETSSLSSSIPSEISSLFEKFKLLYKQQREEFLKLVEAFKPIENKQSTPRKLSIIKDDSVTDPKSLLW